MVSDEQDGPVEIELTAHAPKRGRSRRDAVSGDVGAAPTPATPPAAPDGDVAAAEPQPGWLGSERSRLLMSVSAAAVVALLIGWMLGRSGTDSTSAGEDASPAATTTPAATTEPEADEPDPAFEGAEELPDADVDLDDLFTPATTAPPIATQPPPDREPETAEAEPETTEPEVIEIAFDERVLGRDLTLITVDAQRRLLEIDLSTGTVTQRGEPLPSTAEGLVGGSDWIGVATQGGSGQLFIDRDDGARDELDDVVWWNLAVDTERDVLWNVEDAFASDPGGFVERDLDGEPTGRTIELPPDVAWSAIFDDGAFLATVVGTTYRIGPDGHEAVTSGQVHAASPTSLVVTDCDEELRCGLRIVDRVSGDGRWLPPGPGEAAERYFPLQWYFGNRPGNSFSPDDRWLLVVAPTDFSQDIGLLDLQTGAFVEVDGIGADAFETSWAWAPDGRTAFFVHARVPWVYDVETGESFRLSEDRLMWTGMVVRDNAAG